MSNLGKRISLKIHERCISQKELADMVGVTETAMSRYISGSREPKPETIASIATALHTTSDYLLGIEAEDSEHSNMVRLIARNASRMSDKEKMELIAVLLNCEV